MHQLNFSAIGLSIVLCGCSLTTGYEQSGYDRVLEPWLGASVEEVRRVWGPPDQDYHLPGQRQALVYLRQRNFDIPLLAVDTGLGGPVPTRTSSWKIHQHCATVFEADPAGTIIDVRATGNHCVRVR